MQIAKASDERGPYLIVTCDDGQAFSIDLADRHWLEGKPWRIYKSRGYEACRYVTRTLWINSKNDTRLLHREILSAPKGVTVDHEDWNTLNNRRYNLRLATVHQNHSHVRWERGGRGKQPASGLRGAYQDSAGHWYSLISWHDKRRHLGRFSSAIEAAKAWDAAAKGLRGEFTYLNFPEDAA